MVFALFLHPRTAGLSFFLNFYKTNGPILIKIRAQPYFDVPQPVKLSQLTFFNGFSDFGV